MPVLGRREPGGSSLINILHFLQVMRSGKFEMRDLGEQNNISVYGQPTPPEYNTTTMESNLKNLDMFLIKGGNDVLVTDDDFDRLLSHFKDKVGTTLKYKTVDNYGHLDYIWAKDSIDTVNRPIINFLKQRRQN